MNKKLKTVLLIVLLLIAAAALVWKFVINKPTTDYSSRKPDITFTFSDLMKKLESDSTGIKNKLIAVSGQVKKVIRDSNNVALEIGYDSIMSSVTCQIDNRHLKDFEKISEGAQIEIKGFVSDLSIDAESLFGNTVQMTYCSLNKK